MQKLSLNQNLQQRLSPQQIQFIKLLQIPTVELKQRIEEEMEINPALEEGAEIDEKVKEDEEPFDDYDSTESDYNDETLDIQDYVNQDEYGGYKMQGDGWNEEDKASMPIVSSDTLIESLVGQLGYLKLNEREHLIGNQLIGSIDEDGYIRRPMRAIVNDLAFTQNLYTSIEELEKVLTQVQKLDPPGIAARDLRECLLLQLRRIQHSGPHTAVAIEMMEKNYTEFTKKHFSKIQKKLGITEGDLKEAMSVIVRLNPKPGGGLSGSSGAQYLLPDFLVSAQNGKLEIVLNSKNAPDLRISKSFSNMLNAYHSGDKQNKVVKETVTFIKQKLDSAKWFIDAIHQRQQTLLKTMEAIVRYQELFFRDGDESLLRPMILKDIAEIIQMEISTVSRVANSKSVQTDFGIYPLKYFFSEGISTNSGEDASSREVKNILRDIVDNEPKHAPLSDDKLEKILKKRGYNIARRTVAKYREQLNIPVARLRKQI
ncbi:MAG: RNA polymerase sigma-54 factor [Spirosomataceae bacterium]|jgi:RNA polymerase sigma-54 factor